MNGKRMLNGVLGSLAGGVIFGLMMQMMGSIKMIAMMVGSESALVGWIVHLAISAIFGVAYGVAFGALRPYWAAGLGYGFLWYLLGPLTLMPLFMGMGLQWSAAAVAGTVPSLIGHLIYGGVLGFVYGRLEQAGAGAGVPAAGRAAR